jgi:LPS-assembly protein
MIYNCKNTTFLIFASLLMLLTNALVAQTKVIKDNNNLLLTKIKDTVPLKNNTKIVIDKNSPTTDTGKAEVTYVDTVSIAFSKDSIEAPIDREAIDSAVFYPKQKLFLLYGKAKTNYDDNNIDADFIRLDQERQTLFARGKIDTTGLLIDEQLSLKTKDQNLTADSILYNTKTGQALTHNSRTTSDEMYIQTEKAKLLADKKSFYGYNNTFSTCNYDVPHFCFHTKRIKVVAGDLAVSGFANPEFEGVPMPIGIPFGIFPMKRGKKGGVLPPQFTTNEELGVGLEGLGYYFTFKKDGVQNQFWDLILRTNIYSYGSWNAIITPSYRKRYKYNGAFNLNIQNIKRNFKGDADYFKDNSFNISWSHTADTRARPGVSFSANVNAGKSGFNRNNPNNFNRNISNQMSSSISWAKTWQTKLFGEENTFNLTTSANHSQNTINNTINLNLPDVQFSLQTFYPFANSKRVGTQKWYEKIGVGYNGNLRSQMAFFDNEPLKEIIRTLKDTFQWGATHNIPISLSLPSLGPVQASPSVSYEERTYGQKIFRDWNPVTKKVDTVIEKGIYQARQMSFGFNLATALYGTYNFKTKNDLKARHVIRPTVGIGYTPNMNRRYTKKLQIDSTGANQIVSNFDGNIYSPFITQQFGGINFGIDQNLEIKTKDPKDSTDAGIKRTRIIDGFSMGGSYNLLADSFALSSISINMRSTLANGKLNITAGATLNPYQINSVGRDITKYAWQGQKFGMRSFGRITNANLALSTQFSGGDKTKKADNAKTKNNPNNEFRGSQETGDMTMDEQMRMNDYINSNPAEFVDFNIPWDVNLSAALSVFNVLQSNYTFKKDVTASVNFSGNFSLTSKWKCGANGFYDVKFGKLQQVQMFITREMHCWQLAINVTPIGVYRSFNITLNPKAGILRDLRINRTRFFYGE